MCRTWYLSAYKKQQEIYENAKKKKDDKLQRTSI